MPVSRPPLACTWCNQLFVACPEQRLNGSDMEEQRRFSFRRFSAANKSRSIKKKELFEELRENISRGNDPSMVDTYGAGNRTEFEKGIIQEVLKAKCVRDGRTLLLHAAFKGKQQWVTYMIEMLRQSRAMRDGGPLPYSNNMALVDRLRDVDVTGSPLLCHAASCNKATLHLVETEITKTLGDGGLAEQALSSDRKGRNLLVFAVKSGDVDVYNYAKMLLSMFVSMPPEKVNRPPKGDELSPTDVVENGELSPTDVVEKKRLEKFDEEGRSLLHFAAESASPEMLEFIINRAKKLKVCPKMNAPDSKGRRPMMYVLRADTPKDEKTMESDEKKRDSRDKMISLLLSEHTSEEDKIKDLIPPQEHKEGEHDKCQEAVPALVHAARGGWICFDLTRRTIFKLLKTYRRCCTLEKDWTFLYNATCLDAAPTDATFLDTAKDYLSFLDIALGMGAKGVDVSNEKRDDRRGRLLAEAAKGGCMEVLKNVMEAIVGKTTTDPEGIRDGDHPPEEEVGRLEAATKWMRQEGKCLLSFAIMSREIEAVKYVIKVTKASYKEKAWKRLVAPRVRCSNPSSVNVLTQAALKPPAQVNTQQIFEEVYKALRETARKALVISNLVEGNEDHIESAVKRLLRNQLVVGNTQEDQGLEKRLWEKLTIKGENGNDGSMQHTGHDGRSSGKCFTHMITCCGLVPWGKRADTKIVQRSPLGSAMMTNNEQLFDLICKKFKECEGKWSPKLIEDQLCRHLPLNEGRGNRFSEEEGGVFAADIPPGMWNQITKFFEENNKKSEGGASCAWWRIHFSRNVKALAKQGDFERLKVLVNDKIPLRAHIPALLGLIGENEENIIETVMLAVVNARFDDGAALFVLLNPLVESAIASREISQARAIFPMYRHGLRFLQERLDVYTTELLENLPHTVRGVGLELLGSEARTIGTSYVSGDFTRIRERDRAATILGFVATRWILEPSLASGALTRKRGRENGDHDPLQRALNRGSEGLDFVNSPLVMDYLHLTFMATIPGWLSRSPIRETIDLGFYTYMPSTSGSKKKAKGKLDTSETIPRRIRGLLLRFLQGLDSEDNVAMVPTESKKTFPNATLLPGLQFTLAGIIGKPVRFYSLSVVRFTFELLSYLVMLGLFCASVKIEESSRIPAHEVVFYVFILGLLWREILEFREQLLPSRTTDITRDGESSELNGTRSKHYQGISSALSRYLFYDTWNILDTLTIMVVGTAFVFRVLALREDWSAKEPALNGQGGSPHDFIFAAQFLLAVSCPFLFSRVLFLSQIDDTLGPLTQIIWKMMAHLARFTVFILVIMASFAVAFHALFFTCDSDNLDEADLDLVDSFGTFWSSLLTLFEAMLSGFDFGIFSLADTCNRPTWAYGASVWLLVAYEIIMAILLLNLLIAVLSTVHAKVDAKAEEEYHLARAKLILQISRGVYQRRLPAPFNLIKAILGFIIDIPHALTLLVPRFPRGKPFSSTYKWQTSEEFLQMLIFALSMGLAALVMSIGLWIISTPLIGWRILQLFFPPKANQQWRGYTVETAVVLITCVGWLLGTVVASFFCFFLMPLLSAVLWIIGIAGVVEWAKWRCKDGEHRSKERDDLSVHPGEERGKDWKNARDKARAINFSKDGDEAVHFNVERLLKMTTGLCPNDLWARVKRKAEVNSLIREYGPHTLQVTASQRVLNLNDSSASQGGSKPILSTIKDEGETSSNRSTMGGGGETTIPSPGRSPKRPLLRRGLLRDSLHGRQASRDFN